MKADACVFRPSKPFVQKAKESKELSPHCWNMCKILSISVMERKSSELSAQRRATVVFADLFFFTRVFFFRRKTQLTRGTQIQDIVALASSDEVALIEKEEEEEEEKKKRRRRRRKRKKKRRERRRRRRD